MISLANINEQRIVTNVFVASEASDFPDAVVCPWWVGIGMSIDTPEPTVYWTKDASKKEAETRLAATDWVNNPDVYDTANTPHLTNRDEFLAYRVQIRTIAVNPVEGEIAWPTEPKSVWA